jgi:hypothetical protein
MRLAWKEKGGEERGARGGGALDVRDGCETRCDGRCESRHNERADSEEGGELHGGRGMDG